MKRLFISLVLLLSVPTYADVWTSFNTWDQRWEDQYSEWVTTDWHAHIFTDEKSVYYGIPTDCADASYAMRAIFAYENNLPFAVNDPTRNSKKPISNKMKRWDKFPQNIDRLKAFIKLLAMTLSTASMPQDTVPVALNRDSLLPGITYVKPGVHSYQIIEWAKQGFPVTLNSTTPYSLKTLHKYLSFPAYVPEDYTRFSDGYRRFKRPDELYKPTSSLEGFSLEQFQVSQKLNAHVINFNDYIIEKTQLVKEGVKDKTRRLMFNICYSSFNRISVIKEATDYYNKITNNGRSCMNASEFDQYSTYSRDKRLKEYFVRLKNFMDVTVEFQTEERSSTPPDKYFHLKPYALDIFTDNPDNYRRTKEQFLNFCELDYAPGKVIDVRELWQRIKHDQLIQNPNSSIEWRWGEHPAGYFQTSCPSYQESY